MNKEPILHAAFLKAYADGQEIEGNHKNDGWYLVPSVFMLSAFTCKDYEFRIKPKTILINGIEVPEPVREPMEDRQEYWFVTITNNDFCFRSAWKYRPEDHYRLKIGLIHLTREAAETHARALLSFTAKQGE